MTYIAKHSEDTQNRHPMNDVVGVWGLRILLNLNGLSGLSSFCLTNDGDILRSFGLGELEDSDLDKKEFAKELKRKQLEYENNNFRIEGVLRENLKQFGKLVGLSNTEIKVLGFAVAINSHKGLENIADTLGSLNGTDVIRYLSVILDIPMTKVQKSLDSRSVLSSSGVLRLSKNGNTYLCRKLNLMRGLEDIMQEPQSDKFDMVRDYFLATNNATLNASDYGYIKDDYALISKYLSKTSSVGLSGVNILIHGLPGTGKSELVKTLADDAGLNLYEISVCDRDGDALTGNSRFTSYQLCQKILARQKKSMILFDEVEDVFPGSSIPFLGVKNNGDRRKAWINRLLEDNPVPAIWVSNNIEQIDNAFIRRFDFVLKLSQPPKDIREDILSKHFSDLPVSQQWIKCVAQNKNIVPALVSRAARVISMISEEEKGYAKTEQALEQVMGNTLSAMGYSAKVRDVEKNTFSYRLDALNPDVDVNQLVDGLKYISEARICLYGPPGTGKTEFGRYVAKVLDKPLMVKRASDLLGSYVGMSERNIAEMYKQAQNEDSVLLLDEADSFLRDRGVAQHSWEVTQVNEMLTQMESYNGIFICSTNLVDNLDSASLRRFDFKIHFDYLHAEQSWVLFQQTLEDQGADLTGSRSLKNALSKVRDLTPGDFATVIRQNRLCKERMSADFLLSALIRESSFKKSSHEAGIGFMADV